MSDQTGMPSSDGPDGGDGEQAPGLERAHERAAATMRDRDAITRFFDGLDLVEPGVVQPQQWRPHPGALNLPQVTAWCGVARKP